MPKHTHYRLADVAQVKALASAIRQDIVDAVGASGPCSIAELAEQLGRPADSLYHHVRQLVRRRLLTLTPAPRGVGRPAALVDVPGRPMLLEYDPGSPAFVAAMTRVVATMLRSALRSFSRAFTPETARVSGKRRNLWAGRSLCWLTAEELEEVNALLTKLVTPTLRGERRRARGRQLYELTFVLSPARVSERNGRKRR